MLCFHILWTFHDFYTVKTAFLHKKQHNLVRFISCFSHGNQKISPQE